MLHRIVQEIHQNLHDHLPVHVRYDHAVRQGHSEISSAFQADYMLLHLIDNIIDDLLVFFDELLSTLDSGHAQYIFHHLHQPHGLLYNVPQKIVSCLSVHSLVLDHQAAVPHNPCQGCSEVMGNTSQHTALHVFPLHLQFGLFLLRIDQFSVQCDSDLVGCCFHQHLRFCRQPLFVVEHF